MKLLCPKCRQPIVHTEINTAADLATCIQCDEVFKASELLTETEHYPHSQQPPSGSKIIIDPQHGTNGAVIIPARRLTAFDAPPLAFSIFWLSFVAFWTWGASHGGIFFALFSVPFWLVGLGILGSTLAAITEKQILAISAETLTVTRKNIIFSKATAIPLATIDKIDLEQSISCNSATIIRRMRQISTTAGTLNGLLIPTITHGVSKTRFGEQVSEAEMKWLIGFLKATVLKRIRKHI